MTQGTRLLAERYALEERAARGGMAEVWRARDEVLARTVAVKILLPHLSKDEEFLERFRREALAAARLTHPNIVAIYDTGEETSPDGSIRHYIVMEYCGQGSLEETLRSQGRLSADHVVAVGAAVCDAIAYAHDNGVIHRDLKPANFLVSEDGTLKVADFGIAKAAFSGHDLTTTGSLLGTATYLSPEQANGQEPDRRSDVYQLGVSLYELLIGRPPFAAETAVATAMKHLKESPKPLRSLRADVPRPLEAAVMKALEKDPTARFSSAHEFRTALLGGGSSTTVMPVARPRAEGALRPHREPGGDGSDLRWMGRIVAMIVVAIALVAGLVWLVSPDETSPGSSGAGDGGAREATIEISTAADFDPPPGDGAEHSTEVPQAFDGDEATVWSSEDYSTSLQDQKPGIGLVFDLGSSEEVADSAAEETIDFDPESARYWLIWITDLPNGGPGSAAIAEVRFFGG